MATIAGTAAATDSGPTIGFLSPPGATVGGSAFTLTVTGSGFTAGATVLWNNAVRPTAVVSTTQLNAAIPATDIAAAGVASVTAHSASGLASNAIAFSTIPDIASIVGVLSGLQASLTTSQQITDIQPSLAQALGDLTTYRTIQDAAMSVLQGQLSAAQQQVTALNTQNTTLNTDISKLIAQVAQLQGQIATTKTQSASPLEVAQSLKGVIDQIQQTAHSAPGVQTTLTNMNIQIKALVNVTRAARTDPAQVMLVFPDPTALPDPNVLSTVTLSFGAIPNLAMAATGSPAGLVGAAAPAEPRLGAALRPGAFFDDPGGRAHWFRRSRRRADGRLPGGLVGRASRQKRRAEALQRVRPMAEEPGRPATPPGTAAPPGPSGSVNWTALGPNEVAHGAGGSVFPVVSGRVTTLAIGAGGTRIYAGAANGGIWFSGDGGGTWTALDQFATSPTTTGRLEADALSVGAIAVVFGAASGPGPTPDTIYVGTGEPSGNLDGYFGIGIKVSADSGASFTLEATNLAACEIYRIVIDPADSTIVFAATTTGIYRRPAGPDFSTWTNVADPDASLANSPVMDLVVAGSGAARVYYAATVNKVFQSSDIFAKADGSASWTAVSGIANPNPDPINYPLRKSLTVGENDKSVVYCVVQDGTLFRLDSGTTGAFQPVGGVPKALFAGSQGWYDIVAAADPSDANTIYLVGDLTADGNGWALALFKGKVTGGPGSYVFPFNSANDQTTPGDATTTANVPNDATWIGRGVHPDGHALAFATNADGTHNATNVWVGCDGGVFQSTTSGALGSFVSKNRGLGITQMTYAALRADTADRMYAGCQDNGTLHYAATDMLPWSQSGGGDGGGVAIDPQKTSQILRQYVRATLETTADDGATWGDAGLPVPVPGIEDSRTGFYGPVPALAAGGKTLVAFGTNRLWFRTDWGDPWVTLPTATNPYVTQPANLTQDVLDDPTPTVDANGPSSASPVPVTAISFASATTMFAATSGFGAAGKVWRFDQAESIWTRTQLPAISGLPTPGFVFVTAVALEDATKGSLYAALGSGGGEHVLYFDGTNWQSAGLAAATLDIPAHAVVVHPADANTVFLGTDVGVWKGMKSATSWTWSAFSQGLPEAAVTDLVIYEAARKLRAATHGRGVWEIPIDWPASSSSASSHSSSSSDTGSSSSGSDSPPLISIRSSGPLPN